MWLFLKSEVIVEREIKLFDKLYILQDNRENSSRDYKR